MMFICEKNHSCCDFQYWDRQEDVEQEAKECGHLIEVVPVVHGAWIPIKVPTGIEFLGIKEMVVGFIRCSECYMEFDVSCEWYSHYCPNCGARMDGGDA